jgi:hypothetical protein
MGNWTIIIEGTGSHHNRGALSDADVMLLDFVLRLRKSGQSVEHVSFTSAARDRGVADMALAHPAKEPFIFGAASVKKLQEIAKRHGIENWHDLPRHPEAFHAVAEALAEEQGPVA